VKLVVCETPSALRRALGSFVDCSRHRRCHEGLGNVTPVDVYYRRREEILKARKDVKERTLALTTGFHRPPGSERAAEVSIRKCAKKSERKR